MGEVGCHGRLHGYTLDRSVKEGITCRVRQFDFDSALTRLVSNLGDAS
jgi:hypothetical protein